MNDVISLSTWLDKEVAIGYMASTICLYVRFFVPPSVIMFAVSAAIPNLPAGSFAAPVLNTNRNVIRGDLLGSATTSMALQTVAPISRTAGRKRVIEIISY